MEMHEQLKNHFDLLPDDKQEEEAESKTAELGEVLFQFLLYEAREDIQQTLDGIEEHVNTNIGNRETKITRALNDD